MRRVQQLGPYSLLYRIASGGMAEIYRARVWSLEGDQDVAIKRLLPVYNSDDEFIVMLTDEARITRLFDHPNIARVFEFGLYDNQYFLVMEFIDGQDLRALLKRLNDRGMTLSVGDAIYIVAHALLGLHAAHCQKDGDGRPLDVIHRDFTPSNILLGYDGAVKLVDFGIAKDRLSRSRTQAGFIKGKIKYMSPEQTRSSTLDGRSDVFAAGVVLYRCITGQLPFDEKDDDRLIDAVRERAPTPPSYLCDEIDGAFDTLLYRALAKDRDDRFDSAADFSDALLAWSARAGVLVDASSISKLLCEVFSAEREDAARLQAGVIFDADPTPTSERQSYTRLVGVDDPYPRTLTGFEAVTESRHISGKKRGGNTEPGGTDSEL
ncbi:MAG: serine/threonine-protein kinase [Myxococcota bacterium]|nr:serine/threonine-protein kinase [Myxococcota bacterium]